MSTDSARLFSAIRDLNAESRILLFQPCPTDQLDRERRRQTPELRRHTEEQRHKRIPFRRGYTAQPAESGKNNKMDQRKGGKGAGIAAYAGVLPFRRTQRADSGDKTDAAQSEQRRQNTAFCHRSHHKNEIYYSHSHEVILRFNRRLRPEKKPQTEKHSSRQ